MGERRQKPPTATRRKLPTATDGNIKRRAASKKPVATIYSTKKMPPSTTDLRTPNSEFPPRLPASHKETKVRAMNSAPAHGISKRGRVGEGRPSLYTPELASRLADHIAAGLTDEESAALEDISPDCITALAKRQSRVSRHDKKGRGPTADLATRQDRERGTRPARHSLERIYPARFARPDRPGPSFCRKGHCPARGRVRRPYWPPRLPPSAITETCNAVRGALFM
jgi:hypothetical protein